ncbi:MAG TPA: tetratricopeptide repeat protein, partial [Bacteroidia bacterium]|nr:tetratricopeptide repeat protein [Bacteroidia bacterium]
MKRKNFFRLFFTLLLAGMTSTFSSLSAADNASDLFHQGNIAYQKGDYITAVQLYSGLLKSGKVSSEVYYNLGNAYYKTDSIAKAILSYERAKKLNPDDEDVAVNLKIASLRVVDKIEPLPKIFYKQWLHSLATAFSADNWGIFFLTMIWLAF